MRSCGCSLASSCPPPPPPPPVSASSLTLARRCQEPSGGIYAARNPLEQRPKPSVYWHVAAARDDERPRRTNLSADGNVISGHVTLGRGTSNQATFGCLTSGHVTSVRITCGHGISDEVTSGCLTFGHVISGGESDDAANGNSSGAAGDGTPNPDKSPDLVLNGKRRDTRLTGGACVVSTSSACSSGQDDRRCNNSTVQKRFNNQQTADSNK